MILPEECQMEPDPSRSEKMLLPHFLLQPTLTMGVIYSSQALSTLLISFSKHMDLWIQSPKGFPKHSQLSPYLERETLQ
jgi:hypothetical protein